MLQEDPWTLVTAMGGEGTLGRSDKSSGWTPDLGAPHQPGRAASQSRSWGAGRV